MAQRLRLMRFEHEIPTDDSDILYDGDARCESCGDKITR